MTQLTVRSVSKSFGDTPVLRDVTFQTADGEVLCLLGPSGCGKTTLLRIVAGLETADAGQVALDQERLDDVPPHMRGVGLMFQDYALFPHKDVASNVAFGLRMQRLPAPRVGERVQEMLDLVGLVGYGKRRVYQLSGGEQQRVALARCLAPSPRLLMLDEPLGSLDRALRDELLDELRAILRRVGVTALYVTHDQQEAFVVADRVVLLNRGRVVQQGTPAVLYRQPATTWVARFFGLTNLLEGHVLQGAADPDDVSRAGVVLVQTAIGELQIRTAEIPAVGSQTTVLIRPEAARLTVDCAGAEGVSLRGTLLECSFRGGHHRLRMRHPSGQELAFDLVADAGALPRPGEVVSLVLDPEAMGLVAAEPATNRGGP